MKISHNPTLKKFLIGEIRKLWKTNLNSGSYNSEYYGNNDFRDDIVTTNNFWRDIEIIVMENICGAIIFIDQLPAGITAGIILPTILERPNFNEGLATANEDVSDNQDKDGHTRATNFGKKDKKNDVRELEGAEDEELSNYDNEEDANVDQDCQGNDNIMADYESNDDLELSFSVVNKELDLISEVDNIVRDSTFHVQPDGQIRFILEQTHDSVYTLRHALVDYIVKVGFTYKRTKNEPGFIL